MSVPATFAAGCYWGTERYFKKQFKGALTLWKVGFMGGPDQTAHPTYKEVCAGTTGHAEVLHILYDPVKVSYEDLVKFFFRMHNPTTKNRQGNDVGTQYRSAIFYHNAEQKAIAEAYIEQLRTDSTLQAGLKKTFNDGTIATTLEPASKFFEAHAEHQEYLDVNPDGYCNHRVYW
ncbi:peptide methionine sulfoxide reductase-like, putative [Bodo saltans]|uniref:peptide-methionine (S)-S-oxide reductase n=1 Tax=Bodo saltans TaxID=75058 RepID=A0A0S4JG89_BODSA|nr:peptide methionine sulfoxide reductase-like, putative [Bodo saltans]|eukprot:CUG89127.1 peptide methionine sulfoxide reductase-like, putative [Bodo saltans]